MAIFKLLLSASILLLSLNGAHGQAGCSKPRRYGPGPASSCATPSDPKNKPASPIEAWFKPSTFHSLFPKSNLGWGDNKCSPYSYEAFVIAARYFPKFGTEAGKTYTAYENARRDVSAFFAHTLQETGENDDGVYAGRNKSLGDSCYFHGGLYHWIEGSVNSQFLSSHAGSPSDGTKCTAAAQHYCDPNNAGRWPCKNNCYIGRGAYQLSWNYNYGQFQDWLKTQGVNVDLLANPNLILTSTNPPLALMSALWFYMTPQAPKPSMHNVVIGNWSPTAANKNAGYQGAIFGPTSLIINNECGVAGETRRINAFKWFTGWFKVPSDNAKTITCANMPQRSF